jgi:hypothetical protein
VDNSGSGLPTEDRGTFVPCLEIISGPLSADSMKDQRSLSVLPEASSESDQGGRGRVDQNGSAVRDRRAQDPHGRR